MNLLNNPEKEFYDKLSKIREELILIYEDMDSFSNTQKYREDINKSEGFIVNVMVDLVHDTAKQNQNNYSIDVVILDNEGEKILHYDIPKTSTKKALKESIINQLKEKGAIVKAIRIE
jgi:hypothetical protein